jgi:hypothetical protein
LANTNDVKYVEALALIREGKRVLESTTRADMPNFVLRNPVDLEREQRIRKMQDREELVRKAILGGFRQRRNRGMH